MKMSHENMGALRIGTSSWSFPDWRGVFYPPGTSADRQLNHYATKFNSVEINTSFYALPAPKTVRRWQESVTAEFTFSLKAPREITHERQLVDVDELTEAYLEVARSFGTAAGPGLMQFPATVSRARAGRRLADFFDRFAPLAASHPFSVEVRAVDLMTPAFVQFLMERQIGFVTVERVGQPDTFSHWQAAAESADPTIPLHIRLIGRDRDPLPDDRLLRRPQDKLLDKWAQRIAAVLQAGRDVYCYVHNPFEGHAPETVRRLRARVGELLPLPEWRPDIVTLHDDEESGQLGLF